MSQVQIEYFGVRATGKNLTEAKRAAGAIIEKELKEDYSPRYMVVTDYVLFLYASRCWAGRIRSSPSRKPNLFRFSSGMGHDDTVEKCEKTAAHLAQSVESERPVLSTRGLAVLKDLRDLKEFQAMRNGNS